MNNEEQIRKICLSFPAATENIQWKSDLVFKVSGKMFACLNVGETEASGTFSFKCTDDTFYELAETPGIIPAPYLARAQWVLVDPESCALKAARIEVLVHDGSADALMIKSTSL